MYEFAAQTMEKFDKKRIAKERKIKAELDIQKAAAKRKEKKEAPKEE